MHDVKVYYPVRKMFDRRKGVRLVTDQPILPGYLMVSSENDLHDHASEVRRIPGSYGFLYNLDKSITLKGADLHYAAWIMGNKGVIKPSKVVFTPGEPVKVLEGPLADLRGTILRVDRRGARVTVAFEFADVVRKVSLPIEIVSNEK